MSDSLEFYVNGRKIVDPNAKPEETLLSYLRKTLGLCGTKLACGEGGCGACTVMVSFFDGFDVKHISVNACLAPIASVHGKAVTTVEGIGSTRIKLHSIQKKLSDYHGSQCGFCTPGIVMSMYTLIRNEPHPNMEDIEANLQGNLCRCTGYRPILDGFRSFARDVNEVKNGNGTTEKRNGCCNGKMNGNCCMNSEEFLNGDSEDSSPDLLLDETQEPIFPPDLKFSKGKTVQFKSDKMYWVRPNSLTELVSLKNKYPNGKLVVGNTEIGIEMRFQRKIYPVIIDPTQIRELKSMTEKNDGVVIGGACTLEAINDFLKKMINKFPPWKTRIYGEIVEMLRWFASKQIRNVGCIAGNIMTGSPISDLNPILMAAGCELTVVSEKGGYRTIPFDNKFFVTYRKNVVREDEVLISVRIPFTNEKEFFIAFKQARRRDDDIAIVNAAFFFTIMNKEIHNSRIAYGGVAPITLFPTSTVELLKGKPWNITTIERAFSVLLQEVNMKYGAPGGMEKYRQTLVISFLYKAYLTISRFVVSAIDSRDRSATERLHKRFERSQQIMDIVNGENPFDPVGKPLKHISSEKQTSGEAAYVDDIPSFKNQLYGAFVLSRKANAKILALDWSKCERVEGFVEFLSACDVPRNSYIITVPKDELVFADGYTRHVGEIIGMVLAKSEESAREAVEKVYVSYEEYSPIITITDAIEAGSFIGDKREINKGNIEKAFSESHLVIEGESSSGGQEHFYLEPQITLVNFDEEGEITVISSTQNLKGTQSCVAQVLGVPMSKVKCVVKRIGGGFGGKETRSIVVTVASAFAANKHKTSVKACLTRDEDMMISGHRHPSLAKYKIGVDKGGIVKALDIEIYLNAGCTLDLSQGVLDRAVLHCDNAYNFENIRIKGYCCKTNLASNTAFRGFGGPQGMAIVESAIESISQKLGMNSFLIRKINMYDIKDHTFYGQPVINCNLTKCWDECIKQCKYYEEVDRIEEFNRNNRWKKRGIAIIPTKFGISFGKAFLNQGGCLVHIYHDGSVLISSGGIEMGQGLHTKVIQVASKALNIPTHKISILETGTDKVPNASPTAASVGSDLYGMAALKACTELVQRLKKITKSHPDKSWEDIINLAYFDRICLSAIGFYKIPNLSMDWAKGRGTPFNYFTSGVGCSVVEIDTLTGDHSVLNTNIVMDLGESINPGIDIGQIEGAFMQGYGLFVMEQLLHTPKGALITRGPSTYKIPSFGDIPSEFNVSLLRGSSNPRAVFSSKGVGEPPLFLGASVYFAINEAIKASRKEQSITEKFTLPIPATAERIRMLCEDWVMKKVPDLEENAEPWGIQV